MLPHEDEIDHDLAQTLAPLAAFVAQVACETTAPLEAEGFELGRDAAASVEEMRVLLGLWIKSARTYRALCKLALSGLTDDAHALVRHLFENLVTARFLTDETVTLQEGGKPIPEIQAGRPLSREFRAMLYRAHHVIELVEAMKEFGHDDQNPPPRGAHLLQLAPKVKDWLGAEWLKRRRKGWAGVGFKDLSKSVGLYDVYLTVYRQTSWEVHGHGADSLVQVGSASNELIYSAAPSSDRLEVSRVLVAGTAAYLPAVLAILQRLDRPDLFNRIGALQLRLLEISDELKLADMPARNTPHP